jgi:heavy metal translocating P-type ATPase
LVENTDRCELCALPIDGHPVVQNIGGEPHNFRCPGCARVYDLAHGSGMLEEVLPQGRSRPQLRNPFPTGESAHFSVSGMWCAGCAVAAEEVIRRKPGVRDVAVSFAAERGRIEYDPNEVDVDTLLGSLDSLGYHARRIGGEAQKRSERQQNRMQLQLITAVVFSMQVMTLYFVQLYPLYGRGQFNSPAVRHIQYVVWALATPVLFWGGSSILRGGWRALRARTATMDTLVALGTLSAYFYSAYVALTGAGEAYFDSVAMITTFIMIGRFLELLGGNQARKDVRALLTLQPDQATRWSETDWEAVAATALERGDLILLRPGERIPADCRVASGAAAVDESMLSGESAPVQKGEGDPLYAGTIVTDSALTARLVDPPSSSRLAQITQMVERTLAAKPPIQRLADRAATIFAYGIISIAALTGFGWYLRTSSASEALLAGVAVLVVACPCALGLATPLAITITLGRTTQQGLIVRKAAGLEIASKVTRIVFDKTGTLTQGRTRVVSVEVEGSDGTDQAELLAMAAAVEQFSEHPLARAIITANLSPVRPAREFRSLRGLGVSASVQDGPNWRVMVGSEKLFPGEVGHGLRQRAETRAERGEILVWVGWDDGPAGFISLRDEPNPTARDALQKLAAEGVRAVMLSGDHPKTTKAVAEELGIAEYQGNCPPERKAALIQEWQRAGEKVAMAGDGVNDAPALAQADLSLTAAGGTDVAGETSDIVMTREDLTLIPWLIGVSRRTRRIIIENLGWAFAYNLIAVPLAVLGMISPVIAAAAMATSSLLVVGNSLRLRRGEQGPNFNPGDDEPERWPGDP